MKRHAVGLLAWVRGLIGLAFVGGGVGGIVESDGSVTLNAAIVLVGLALTTSGILTLRRVLSEPAAL